MPSFHSPLSTHGRLLRLAPVLACGAAVVLFARDVLLDSLALIAGASVTAFLCEPLATFYERRLTRNLAALASVATVLGAVLGGFWLLTPTLIRETVHLIAKLPESVAALRSALEKASGWIQGHFSGVAIPAPAMEFPPLPALAEGTLNIAGDIANLFTRLSLMVVLGYFLLCERARLMILLELLMPLAIRRTAVQMGNAVCRELRLYLRGQGLISLFVGAITSLALFFAGLPSPMALGAIVGVFNMIPYFGPVIGGVPAVLTALGYGWHTAALTIVLLWVVQQIDGSFISPRVMSSMTGLSPASVLLAIFIGSGVGGIVGMLTALPFLMTFRTVFRIFVQKRENV